jgi:FkbM family methyltransferase
LPSKFCLLKTYLQLQLKQRFDSLPSSTPKTIDFDGQTIEFTNYSSLKSMLLDIFIRRDYYFEFAKQSPIIVDCGSNIGVSALYFKKLYPDAHLTCFEPDPLCFRLLSNSVTRWGLSNTTLHNKAVYDKEGTMSFESNLSMSKLDETRASEVVVETVLLSDYITEPVDILKIDIEGAEKQVIHELARHNKLSLIKNIIMEFHYSSDDDNGLPILLSDLKDHGFHYQIKSVRGQFDAFTKEKSKSKELRCLMIFAYQD